MDFTNGTIITCEEKNYIIIETLTHENKTYAFTNELKGTEDLTEDYYIFQLDDNKIIKITNENLINSLLNKFQEKLKITIEKFL